MLHFEYISRPQHQWFEPVGYAIGVGGVGGRKTNVEKEIERAIHCYNANIANTNALGAVLIWEPPIRLWNPERIAMPFG
jgi:hypothetical protein